MVTSFDRRQDRRGFALWHPGQGLFGFKSCVTLAAGRVPRSGSFGNAGQVGVKRTPPRLLALAVVIAEAVSLRLLPIRGLAAPSTVPFRLIHAEISETHFAALLHVPAIRLPGGAESVTQKSGLGAARKRSRPPPCPTTTARARVAPLRCPILVQNWSSSPA